jgi:hypothetical protein
MRLAHIPLVPRSLWSFEQLELILAVIVTLSLYGDAFPYRTPIVFPLTLLGFGWVGLVQRKLTVPSNAGFAFTVACVVFYLIGILETSYLYNLNVRDLRNVASLLLLSPMLCSLRDMKQFQTFCKYTRFLGASAGTALAIIGLYKYNLMAEGRELKFLFFAGRQYPWGTSLIVDYNFYAFAMLAGAISCTFCLCRGASFSAKALSLCGLALTIASMSLSGSRRGWVTEGLFLIILVGLTLRWVGLNLWRSLRSALDAKVNFQSIVLLFTVAILFGAAIRRLHPAFLDSNRTEFQVQSKSLQGRFDGLTQPAASFEGRSDRWVFASHLLENASPLQFLFGQGFDYLHIYAVEFPGDTPEDYPHNPIISASLFSGIVGGSLVLTFLMAATLRYFRARKSDMYFASLYTASLCFVIPSYNSIFSGKLFGLLLLIPWSIPLAEGRVSHAKSSLDRPEFVHTRLPRAAAVKYSR